MSWNNKNRLHYKFIDHYVPMGLDKFMFIPEEIYNNLMSFSLTNKKTVFFSTLKYVF